MKKIVITLSLVAGLMLLLTGSAFAVVGAEPPPEGMMGITAVQEPSEPVENAELYDKDDVKRSEEVIEQSENTAPDREIHYAITSVQEDGAEAAEGEVRITDASAETAPVSVELQKEAVEKEKAGSLATYGIAGLLGVGALVLVARKKLK